MKHKILSLIISSLLLVSCCDCAIPVYFQNMWKSFYDEKVWVNFSTYFDDDYLVIGTILKEENETYAIKKDFIGGYNSEKIDLDLIEYLDSTGEEIKFDDNGYFRIKTSRTIKVDYKNLPEESKTLLEKQNSFSTASHSFFHLTEEDERYKRVDFCDDLSKVNV